MTVIKASLKDQALTVSTAPVVASGGVEEDVVTFEFDSTWAEYVKKAVFYRDERNVYHVDVGSDNTAVIPWEVLQQAGHMYFGVFGTKGSEVKTSTVAKYRVERGAITIASGIMSTPDIFSDVIANTAARHSHDNKTVLDGITADDVAKWDSNSESSSAPGGSVVIEGTASDDMSEVTITTPDAWTLVSEAWNSEKRPLVVLRLSDVTCAYLTSVSTWAIDGQSQGMALFSIPPFRHLNSTPPYSIWLDESGGAAILPVESIDGADGVGIQSVTQTTTSTEDGGANIITVTKTDGTSSTFTVRNGSKGSTGATGARGATGAAGYTPVRGTDYWTADDVATIQSYIDEKAAVFQSKTITDSGGYFHTDTVEGALQEIGAELAGTNTLLGSGIQISFTIDGETFSAVSGETWKEWVGSGYKTIENGMILSVHPYDDEGVIFLDEAGVYALSLDGNTPVRGGDRIISGAAYVSMNWGG